MVQPIMKDPVFLAQKSAQATKEDLPVSQDLLDTLIAHRESCVGMAANMIGVSKRIIVFDNEGTYMQSGDCQMLRAIRGGRKLPLPEREAENKALSQNQGAIPERGISDPTQNL